MACVCSRYNARSDWLIVTDMPTGRFRNCKTSFGLLALLLLLMSYDKKLNNLDRSVVTGKSQTPAYAADLAIARSIQQGLSLRFSRKTIHHTNDCAKNTIVQFWSPSPVTQRQGEKGPG